MKPALCRAGRLQRILRQSDDLGLLSRLEIDDFSDRQVGDVAQLFHARAFLVEEGGDLGEAGSNEDFPAFRRAPADTERDARAVFYGELADQALGDPDAAMAGKIGNTRSLVDRVAEHDEFDTGRRLVRHCIARRSTLNFLRAPMP